MKIIKKIQQGQMIPAWYGVAWENWCEKSTTCLPIGMNLIASAMRGIATWVRHGGRSISTNPREAYNQGFADGRASRA